MRQLLGLLGAINGRPREKRKKMVLRRPVREVELRVRMDCERCEREVKKALSGMRGWSPVALVPWPCALALSFSLLASIAPMTNLQSPAPDDEHSALSESVGDDNHVICLSFSQHSFFSLQ